MQPVYAANRYKPVDDLCIITTYFSACNYRTLLKNYLAFRESMESSSLSLFTVECAFGDAPFQLQPSENILQVRSNAVLWQKERLLNVALASVGEKFSKIAWIDADLFFTDPDWAVSASRLLDDYPLVQLFEQIISLPRDATAYDGIGEHSKGFASMVSEEPSRLKQGYERHGRTGGAWAARSEVLNSGIFDACILGDNDHVMAHAMLGDWSSGCIENTFFRDLKAREYFESWAARFFAGVQGEITFLPGTILHRWHGSRADRRYRERSDKLARFGVDPTVDLRLNCDLCWEWNTQRPRLHDYVAGYFALRNDDGDCREN